MNKIFTGLAVILVLLISASAEEIYTGKGDLGYFAVASSEDTEGFYIWMNVPEEGFTTAKVIDNDHIYFYEDDFSLLRETTDKYIDDDGNLIGFKTDDEFQEYLAKEVTIDKQIGDMNGKLVRETSGFITYYVIKNENEEIKVSRLSPGSAGYEMFKATIDHWKGIGKSILTITATVGLNVRSGPGTSYKVLTKVAFEDKVEKLDGKNRWYKVKTADGTVGWICGGMDGEVWVK